MARGGPNIVESSKMNKFKLEKISVKFLTEEYVKQKRLALLTTKS